MVKVDPGSAARRGGAVRLRGAHRGRRRGQHGAPAAGPVGRGDRPGRRRPVLRARRGRVRRAAGRRDRPVRRQAGPGAPTRRQPHRERARRGCGGAGAGTDRRRRGLRLRDGRRGPRDGTGLQDHPPRRHHDHRRPAAARRGTAAAAGATGGRGAHGEGQLYRHLRADARHPALRRACIAPGGCRWTG